MCLRYSFNKVEDADLLEKAISATLDKGLRTADIAGDGEAKVDTGAMGAGIIAELEALSS